MKYAGLCSQCGVVLRAGEVAVYGRATRTTHASRAPSTVKHHLANARSKVGASTTAQLVWILAPRMPGPEDLVPEDDLDRRTPAAPGSPTPSGLLRTAPRQASR